MEKNDTLTKGMVLSALVHHFWKRIFSSSEINKGGKPGNFLLLSVLFSAQTVF
jgi:hypothetical protein